MAWAVSGTCEQERGLYNRPSRLWHPMYHERTCTGSTGAGAGGGGVEAAGGGGGAFESQWDNTAGAKALYAPELKGGSLVVWRKGTIM